LTREIITEELEVGQSVEVSRGVVVERRCFLRSTALALSGLTISGVATAQLAKQGGETMAYEEFLKQVKDAARVKALRGIVGLSIGWGLTLLLRLLLPSYVPLWAPIGGLVASVGIGLIFGLWPAWKAARLDPIESLRYE